MINEQILLFKDREGKYIPYNRINNELCVLIDSKEQILKRLKESVKLYFKAVPIDFIDDKNICFTVNKKYAIYNLDSKEIITDFYDFVGKTDKEGIAKMALNNRVGLIDVTMKKIICDPYWAEMHTFKENLLAVKHPETGKWGFLNENFALEIECKYDEVNDFNNDMAVVAKYIKTEDDLNDIELSLSQEEKEYIKRLLQKFSTINVYGYINKKGELSIPYKYGYARSFYDDMAYTKTIEEHFEKYREGSFIDKNGTRYRTLSQIPENYHNGEALMFIEGSHHEPDEYYAIDKQMNIRKITSKYYFNNRVSEEKKEKEREYKIVFDYNEKNSTYKLMKNKEEVEIDYYSNVEKMVMDFYEKGRLDGNIYSYNFNINKIIPLQDFVIGSRNILTEEEAKPYIRKKIK